ncbi:hypothetical protein Agub_g4254, partial [Astrephomene gubernaculifera]
MHKSCDGYFPLSGSASQVRQQLLRHPSGSPKFPRTRDKSSFQLNCSSIKIKRRLLSIRTTISFQRCDDERVRIDGSLEASHQDPTQLYNETTTSSVTIPAINMATLRCLWSPPQRAATVFGHRQQPCHAIRLQRPVRLALEVTPQASKAGAGGSGSNLRRTPPPKSKIPSKNAASPPEALQPGADAQEKTRPMCGYDIPGTFVGDLDQLARLEQRDIVAQLPTWVANQVLALRSGNAAGVDPTLADALVQQTKRQSDQGRKNGGTGNIRLPLETTEQPTPDGAQPADGLPSLNTARMASSEPPNPSSSSSATVAAPPSGPSPSNSPASPAVAPPPAAQHPPSDGSSPAGVTTSSSSGAVSQPGIAGAGSGLEAAAYPTHSTRLHSAPAPGLTNATVGTSPAAPAVSPPSCAITSAAAAPCPGTSPSSGFTAPVYDPFSGIPANSGMAPPYNAYGAGPPSSSATAPPYFPYSNIPTGYPPPPPYFPYSGIPTGYPPAPPYFPYSSIPTGYPPAPMCNTYSYGPANAAAAFQQSPCGPASSSSSSNAAAPYFAAPSPNSSGGVSSSSGSGTASASDIQLEDPAKPTEAQLRSLEWFGVRGSSIPTSRNAADVIIGERKKAVIE